MTLYAALWNILWDHVMGHPALRRNTDVYFSLEKPKIVYDDLKSTGRFLELRYNN